MKIYYSTLQIELTRRCNQSCKHCCRGECQNVDINKNIIDAFFNNNEIEGISTLMFSGGEPTLNGEMLEYFVDELIKRKIKVYNFIFSINGLSYSQALINGLNKLSDYINYNCNYDNITPGILMITQDQFHKDADKNVVNKLEKLRYFSPIMKTIIFRENILPYGRAIENHLTDNLPDLSNLTNYSKNMKIEITGGEVYLIIQYQYLAANGNVINDGCQDYITMDKYSLGNVVSSSIVDMYILKMQKRLVLKKEN